MGYKTQHGNTISVLLKKYTQFKLSIVNVLCTVIGADSSENNKIVISAVF